MIDAKEKNVYEVDVHEISTYEIVANDEISDKEIEEQIKNEDPSIIKYGERTKTRSVVISQTRKVTR